MARIRGSMLLSTAVVYLLAASPASADYPADCFGGWEPSSPDCSMFPEIGYVGCCDSEGRSVWCDQGALYCVDCENEGPSCGWSPFGGYYDCGTEGGADPSGQYQFDCATCEPACESGYKCVAGVCEECIADCNGKSCGGDGCGGSCGECAVENVCVDGICMGKGCTPEVDPGCGGCYCEACVCGLDSWCCTWDWDSVCVDICIEECGGCPNLEDCGDDACDGSVGETCGTCPVDCLCGAGTTCFKHTCCAADCDEKECGDDACGGHCGQCEVGEICEEFACLIPPSCEVAGAIHCDETVVADSDDFGGVLDAYDCTNQVFLGPETAYQFYAKEDDLLLVTLAGIGFGTDVRLLAAQNSCSSAACFEVVSGGQMSVEVEKGTTYFFVIDSPEWDDAGEFVLSVVCQSSCEPDCAGKKCGDDGCNGVCGMCPEGFICKEHQCLVHDGCTPAAIEGCPGCACEACVCEWDDWCCWFDWDEWCVSICIDDCGGCPDLSGCGNGLCDDDVGEDCGNCTEDCACSEPEVCFEGECCLPDCTGVECGSDGCGGDCGDCGDGLYCSAGICGPNDGCSVTDEPGCSGCLCGDCVCSFWPECCTWEWDFICVMVCDEFCEGCGLLENCGDGECDVWGGESCGNCPADCTCGAGESCYDGECCAPACSGQECGDDGCGGSCGQCPPGEACAWGECQSGGGCIATYDYGCGGCPCEACVCGMDSYCCDTAWDDICVDVCVSYCGGCEAGDPCGDDVCSYGDGEDCDSCPADCACKASETCIDGQCCKPDCVGKECGSDSCGGGCGGCDYGEYCSLEFQCVENESVEPDPDVFTGKDSGGGFDLLAPDLLAPDLSTVDGPAKGDLPGGEIGAVGTDGVALQDGAYDDGALTEDAAGEPGKKSGGCGVAQTAHGAPLGFLLLLLLTLWCLRLRVVRHS